MLCSAKSLAPWLTEFWHINSPVTLIANEIWYSAVLNNILWYIALHRCIKNIIWYIALQSCIENIIWYIALQRCIESRKIRDGVPPDKCHQGSSSTTVPLNLGSAGFSIRKSTFSSPWQIAMLCHVIDTLDRLVFRRLATIILVMFNAQSIWIHSNWLFSASQS